jgi:peptidoglycan/LPS O-acetylase OafA/YrhL
MNVSDRHTVLSAALAGAEGASAEAISRPVNRQAATAPIAPKSTFSPAANSRTTLHGGTADSRAQRVAAPDLPARIPSLDGLRAVSIVLVFLAHVAGTRHAPRALDHLQQVGNYGVKIFFEISGFLITTLLLQELARSGKIRLRSFYGRRVLRIFPAFYTYVGVIFALAIAGVVQLRSGDLLHALTYTMNYHHNRGWYLNHLWSLAVEEQFYLIWPVLICALGAVRSLRVAAAAVVAAPLVRLVMWVPLGASATAMTREFQAVADALATGCLLAGCYNWLGTCRRYVAFLASPGFIAVPVAGLVLPLSAYLLKPGLFYVVGQSIAHLAIALCIDRCVRFPRGWVGLVLNSRPLVYVGALSYSLYLWQEPFLNSSRESNFTTFPKNILLAVLAAIGSYYLIERPFLKLKHRFQGAARPGPALLSISAATLGATPSPAGFQSGSSAT